MFLLLDSGRSPCDRCGGLQKRIYPHTIVGIYENMNDIIAVIKPLVEKESITYLREDDFESNNFDFKCSKFWNCSDVYQIIEMETGKIINHIFPDSKSRTVQIVLGEEDGRYYLWHSENGISEIQSPLLTKANRS